MSGEQCVAVQENGIRCVMELGHPALSTEHHHNFGGLGPFTAVRSDGPEMSVDELRAAVGPGGVMEFTHVGATLEVTAPMTERLRAAVVRAVEFGHATLVRASGFEGVLISRDRYLELVALEKATRP